jgi:hypothetical protein
MWKNQLIVTQRDGRNIDEYDVYNKVSFILYLHNTAVLKHVLFLCIASYCVYHKTEVK